MSLSPDDHQQPAVALYGRHAPVAQPYLLASLMVGGLVLLLGRLCAPFLYLWSVWAGAALIVLLVYNLLHLLQVRLPIGMLCVVAAELGCLLSLPISTLHGAMHDLTKLSLLLAQIICAGVIGAFLAWSLSADRYPNLVIGISFLGTFVVMSLFELTRALFPY